MAKSRAQRKAEAARRRQLEQEQGRGIESDSEAQHDTQVPESADVLEAEIAIEKGAEAANRTTDAPAPSRADVGKPETADAKASRRERKRQEREQAERTKAQLDRRTAKAPVAKERGPVLGFFSSVQKELQKVQWPDRDTLVQASAVTLLFVTVAAAYLGALDAVFSRLVDVFIT